MTQATTLISATPVLASLDIERSVEFFCTHLGFRHIYAVQNQYGIVNCDTVSIHFWACMEKHIAENTSCRIAVTGVEALYERCKTAGIVHPRSSLQTQPWGSIEFGIVDPDGNLVTFSESIAG